MRPVSARTSDEIHRAIERTLPDVVACRRAFESAVEALGSRGALVKQGASSVLYRRDPDDPEWVIATPVARWQPDVGPPEVIRAPPQDLGDFELPPRPALPPSPPRPQSPESREKRAGKLNLYEGRRELEACCDATGRVVQRTMSMGDLGGAGSGGLPFAIDPRRVLPTTAPLSILCGADLDPDGYTPEAFGALVAQLRPWEGVPARVWMPVVQPGGPETAAANAGLGIRAAAWSGTFGARAPGHVIADGIRGEVIALGADRAEALARWRDMAAREREGEDLPAVAFPISARPPVPEVLLGLGFSEAMLLYGESGETGWTFLRRSADGGYTAVGERVADRVTPALDAVLDRLEAMRQAEAQAVFGDLLGDRRYPLRYATFGVISDDGLSLGPIRGGAVGSTDRPPTTLPVHAQWEIHRVARAR